MSLARLKVVEFAGLAPGPFAGLILADHGANVIRIDRPSSTSVDVLTRGKRSLAINPKIPSGLAVLRRLISQADVLIDPFRPGVMERLRLGPDVFLGEKGLNQKLIYARIIGFTRTGPHKDMAGHDINYAALSGVLSMLPGSPEKPTFPLNLLGDFAGGGLVSALGILMALVERGTSGCGQVVDTEMVSGVRYISTFALLHTLSQSKSTLLTGPRGTNLLDDGAPFYTTYRCSDGQWMSVGCLEPGFFLEFITRFAQAVGPTQRGWAPTPKTQTDVREWGQLREYLTRGFGSKPRDFWANVFHGTDSCTVPVLSPAEAAELSPTKSALPEAHPRLSRTPAVAMPPNAEDLILKPGQHSREVLEEMGVSGEEWERLVKDGALGKDTIAKL